MHFGPGKRRYYVLVFITILFAAPVYSQTPPPQKALVLYDPLFWKDKLKLDAYQCRRIREINSEYYRMLLTRVRDENNISARQKQAAQTLLNRSEEIWDTFHPRQRRRWRKMWKSTPQWTINRQEKAVKNQRNG